MAAEIEVFQFPATGQEVRTVLISGDPWFVAGDVCAVLGIGRTHDAVRGLDDDEKGTDTIRTLGGDQQVTIVNEPGLYSLVLRSRKPEARYFKRWITHEVLPSIRKTGRYAEEGDRRLIARVVRWALANGWQRTARSPWINRELDLCADVDAYRSEVGIWRRSNGYGRWQWLPVQSVTQAVDLLVAYGVLPVELSSAYEAGQVDALSIGVCRPYPPRDGVLVIAHYTGGHQNSDHERVYVRSDRNEGAHWDGDWWQVGNDKASERPYQWGEVLWEDDPPCDRGHVGLTYYVPADDRAGVDR